MSFSALLQRVQKGLSTIELVHTSHPRWPLSPGTSALTLYPAIHISVLDSSFNPPTLAHLALANIRTQSAASVPDGTDFDARLLLLSVRNADKQLKPGDATYQQRMEMMVLLSQDIDIAVNQSRFSSSTPHQTLHTPNIAVAIVDEPTFVGKSSILLDFLHKRISGLHSSSNLVLPSPAMSLPSPKLTFIMGTDTIVRLFALRYYDDEQSMSVALNRFLSPTGDDSHIVCAHRMGVTVTIPDGMVPLDKITYVNIGQDECNYSSSEVREKVAARDDGWRCMVPLSVASYVAAEGLYTT